MAPRSFCVADRGRNLFNVLSTEGLLRRYRGTRAGVHVARRRQFFT